jgi:uncharacterized membrane protein YccC
MVREVEPRQIWVTIGADLARALSALDNIDATRLSLHDRQHIERARTELQAALEEYRRVSSPEEPFLQED